MRQHLRPVGGGEEGRGGGGEGIHVVLSGRTIHDSWGGGGGGGGRGGTCSTIRKDHP